jgi:hypothetical protein
MLDALTEWSVHQRPQREARRRPIEADIAGIRSVVIRPSGDDALRGWAPNRFAAQPASLSFVILNPEVSVKLVDGSLTRESVYQPLRAARHVLFFDEEQQSILTGIIAKLESQPTTQPPGSNDILKLWGKFFPTDRSWVGVELETSPIITDVEFLNAERTKALARVRAGHEGATVVLEKREGAWIANGVVNQWIS